MPGYKNTSEQSGLCSDLGGRFKFATEGRGRLYGTDSFGRMLDGESLDALAEDKRGVVRRVLDVVRDIIAAIRRALNGQNVTLTQAQRAEFQDLEGRLGEIERTFREALDRAAGRAAGLNGQQRGATMGTEKYSMKEEEVNGANLQKAGTGRTDTGREEGDLSEAHFIREGAQRGEVYKRLEERRGRRIGYRFHPVEVKNYSEDSRIASEELSRLGIENFVYSGVVDAYVNGRTILGVPGEGGVTVARQIVGIENSSDRPGLEAAGHEAFHFWSRTDTGKKFLEMVRDLVDFTTDATQEQYQQIVDDYFGGTDPDIDSQADMDLFWEEMTAYIAGYIHNSDPRAKGMLQNYDAVKAAWERLVEENRGGTRYSRSNREQLDAYIAQYGAIPRGERPYRQVQVPKRTSERQKVSQTVRTILEAGATPEEAVPTIEDLTAQGVFSYDPYSDKQAKADAEEAIRDKGYATALADWLKRVEKGEVSKGNTAEGWALYNAAANAGDMQSAMTILTNMVEHQRNAAQAVQATRILKQLSPEAQLYGVQRSARNLTEELKGKYGKQAPDIRVDPELAEDFLSAKTDKQRERAIQALYRDIGRQMPSRFADKWNAWRYLAMLGNPRTHVRNVVGNAFFAPVVAAKDLTAAAIESAADRVSGGGLGRSKALLGPGSRELLAAAWGDYANVEDQVLGSGKYSDSANANRSIQEGRVIFRNKALETARRANSRALDLEDSWFSKPHYAYALAQYAKANHITAKQLKSGKGLDRARAYAIREAQKATYRDTNAFSQMVSDLGRYRGNNPAKKGASMVLEGILPFRKTPANILVRGVEYSPSGPSSKYIRSQYRTRS